MKASSYQGNVQPGYLVIDANSRKAVGAKGYNDFCTEIAIQDNLLMQDEDEYDINEHDTVDGLTPEPQIDLQRLTEFERNFLRRQYVAVQRYRSKEETADRGQDESFELYAKPTASAMFKNNLKQLLSCSAKAEQVPDRLKAVDYMNAVKIF